MFSNQLIATLDPIEIIRKATSADADFLIIDFTQMIGKMYQYEFFKPFLDLSATLILEGRLKFVITPKENWNMDEGNCKTFEQGVFNKVMGKFQAKKKYIITIRKNTPDLIVHEIGHMVEKESDIVLGAEFVDLFKEDLRSGDFKKLSIRSAVDQVMNKELKNYPQDQLASEIFTRYFQLLAMCKEISGHMTSYAYEFEDIPKAMPHLNEFIKTKIFARVFAKADASIVEFSKRYLKSLENIQHKWSEEKVHSFHRSTSAAQNKWSGGVKSIKDY